MFLDLVRKAEETPASTSAPTPSSETPSTTPTTTPEAKGSSTSSVLLTDSDLDALARHSLNGRQIKNMVRTAQALALNEGEKLCLAHIKKVLEVAETFDRDLKGGTGYIDAMRSYT